MSFKLTATATSAPLPRSHNGLIFLLCHSYTTVTLRLALGGFSCCHCRTCPDNLWIPVLSFFPCHVWRNVGSSSSEAASRLRCSLVGERSSDSESHEAYKTNSGNTLSMCPGHPWLPGSCCACPRMTKKIQGSASATACARQQRFAPQPACAQGRPLVKPATACKATKKKRGAFSQKPPRFQG